MIFTMLKKVNSMAHYCATLYPNSSLISYCTACHFGLILFLLDPSHQSICMQHLESPILFFISLLKLAKRFQLEPRYSVANLMDKTHLKMQDVLCAMHFG